MIIFGSFLLIISFLILNITPLNAIDLAIIEWFSHQRTQQLNEISIVLSYLGGIPFVLFITTLWCFYAKLLKKYGRINFVWFGLLGSISLTWLLKYLISIPRPPEIYHLVNVFGSSFPSGHTVYATALGCLAIYAYSQSKKFRVILFFSIIWMVVMGISRVYLGVHYPSDVLAGWGTGLIYISITYLICIKLEGSRKFIVLD
nr:phosphatase PAP2 family protein [Acinetobacter equi]